MKKTDFLKFLDEHYLCQPIHAWAEDLPVDNINAQAWEEYMADFPPDWGVWLVNAAGRETWEEYNTAMKPAEDASNRAVVLALATYEQTKNMALARFAYDQTMADNYLRYKMAMGTAARKAMTFERISQAVDNFIQGC